jgi:fructose-1,6-bisphosphatase/inositol monophosphatase family enzyme
MGVPGVVLAGADLCRYRRLGRAPRGDRVARRRAGHPAPRSTALHLCYAATGALAFVHDARATLWDIAGAAPVLIEAGGLLTSERGRPIFPLDPDGYRGESIAFLAGDPLAHDQALRDLLSLG